MLRIDTESVYVAHVINKRADRRSSSHCTRCIIKDTPSDTSSMAAPSCILTPLAPVIETFRFIRKQLMRTTGFSTAYASREEGLFRRDDSNSGQLKAPVEGYLSTWRFSRVSRRNRGFLNFEITYVRRVFSDQSISRCATYPAGWCQSCLVLVCIRSSGRQPDCCVNEFFQIPWKAGHDFCLLLRARILFRRRWIFISVARDTGNAFSSLVCPFCTKIQYFWFVQKHGLFLLRYVIYCFVPSKWHLSLFSDVLRMYVSNIPKLGTRMKNFFLRNSGGNY